MVSQRRLCKAPFCPLSQEHRKLHQNTPGGQSSFEKGENEHHTDGVPKICISPSKYSHAHICAGKKDLRPALQKGRTLNGNWTWPQNNTNSPVVPTHLQHFEGWEQDCILSKNRRTPSFSSPAVDMGEGKRNAMHSRRHLVVAQQEQQSMGNWLRMGKGGVRRGHRLCSPLILQGMCVPQRPCVW